MTKILVVDDDLIVLATTTMGLQQVGYEVINADNGDCALQLCQQDKPDFALLDIRMPNMSGIEIAKELKARLIPFIFLSAYSDEDMVKSAGEVGALGYLIKPIEILSMVSAIEVALMRADEQIKSEQVIENLTNALDKNREIDVSIGLLMGCYQINRVVAYELLRTYARSHGLKLAEVAKALVSGTVKDILSKKES